MVYKQSLRVFVLSILLILGLSSPALSAGDDPIATMVAGQTEVTWQPHVEYSSLMLTVSAPGGEVFRKEFPKGVNPSFNLIDSTGNKRPDGQYIYELRLIPVISEQVRDALRDSRENGNSKAVAQELQQAGQLPVREVVQSGSFVVSQGAIISNAVTETPNPVNKSTHNIAGQKATGEAGPGLNDMVTQDDAIIQGSLCVGIDCVDNENFGFDTIRMKENNTRLTFIDTSSSAGFPGRDWRLRANDSNGGGQNAFFIDDMGDTDTDGAESPVSTPFTITAGAPTNSIFLDSTGRLGLRTATPSLDIHVNTGNTPAFRMEQNSSSGFAAQTWDIGANESNFFVRDLTGGSRLPFRIRPGAPTSSIDISASGNVGIGTANPGFKLDITGSVNATSYYLNGSPFNPASFITGTGTQNRITKWTNNGSTLGNSAIYEDANGNIGVGTTTPAHAFTVRKNGGTAGVHTLGELYVDRDDRTRSASFLLSTAGTLKWLFGMPAQTDAFQLYDLAANQSRLSVDPSNGNIGIGTTTPQSTLQVNGYVQLALTAGAPPAVDCDNVSEYGRMKVDAAGNKLYVCTTTGWKSTALVP